MRFMLTTILVLLAIPTMAAAPLNLLIIQTDEHNFRTLGCYRETLPPEQAFIWGKNAIVETPAIDSVAARGALCTSFYATSPVCTPSRASFFTGVYPQHTGSPQNDMPMKTEMVTFAKVLQDNGYATGYAGKWHLDGPGKPQWGPERQFGFGDNRYMFNRGHWKKFEITDEGPRVAARQKGKPSYALAEADEKTFSTDWLTDRAIDFIKDNSSKPFCYHLSLPDPHGPNTVRAPYDTMFENTVIRPPMTFTKTQQNPKWAPATGKNGAGKFRGDLMTQYFGMVRCIDDNVARLLQTLDDLELTERTAIVFTADHGDLCYEHGRLNKGNPYEGSAKIPMIVMVPGKVPAKRVVNEALGTVDFAPTILPLLGFRAPPGTQGRDASSLLTGKSGDWKDILFLRNAGRSAGWIAAVTDRYKLVVSVSDDPWLFDLESDPDELVNAIGSVDPSVKIQLAAELMRYGKEFADPHFQNKKLSQELAELVK
ncbi:MAG: sulfatase [Rubripirellula sp.]